MRPVESMGPRPARTGVQAPARRSVLLHAAAAAAILVGERPLLPCAASEPEAATRLLNLCEKRRPADWADSERPEMDLLIDELVAQRAPWPREALRGKWRLAYLQPGPDGAGVDRRIPFPELPWNDSFQIFGEQSVVNVGELLGPGLTVRVGGGLSEDNEGDLEAPKRFKASINSGGICLLDKFCAPLPIQGEGIFDGQYLSERVRIGQNLNGGGARIVQVRVE